MKFLLFNEVLMFFQIPIIKVGCMMLTLSKFQILNANLWSIYSRKVEFMVYTFICAFSGFRGPQNLLCPSKKTSVLDS